MHEYVDLQQGNSSLLIGAPYYIDLLWQWHIKLWTIFPQEQTSHITWVSESLSLWILIWSYIWIRLHYVLCKWTQDVSLNKW